MTDPQLALSSDIAIWASLAVLALALISFSAHLAVTGTARERAASVKVAERVRVGAGTDSQTEARDGREIDAPEPTGPTTTAVEPPTVSHPAEVTRRWGIIGVQLTWLATFGVVGGTILRGVSVQRWPLGNMYEFAIVAASFALIVYSTWSLKRDRLWLGPFVVLPVMAVLSAGKIWYTEASQLMPALDNTMWLTIHVTLATLSVALFIIGAALGVAFLLRDSAEKRNRIRGWLAGLPQADKLETMTYGIHIFAFPLWTFTLITGAIWAEVAWGRYWGWDPKEIWTFIIWVVYAAYLHSRATSGWTKRHATYVALLGMLCIILNYTVVNLLITGLHSYSGVST